MQLSWNYNYIDAGAALGVDLCASPDLVATDASVAWGTAIWFWMANTGSTGVTAHSYVTDSNSFGGSLKTINGGSECNTAVTTHRESTVSRLDDYCRASNQLGVPVLSLGDCDGLQALYDSCVSTGAKTWGACPSCDGTYAPTASPTTAAPTPGEFDFFPSNPCPFVLVAWL